MTLGAKPAIGASLFYNRFKVLDLWIDKLLCEKNHYADKILEFNGEELWLVFVMYEKYNKIWNGEDWVPKVKVPFVGGIKG